MTPETMPDILTRLGRHVTDSIQRGEFPVLELADRGTRNISYDEEAREYVLGAAKTIRDSANLKHVRSFAQLLWVASFSKQLLQSNRTSSLRDLYYSSEAYGIGFSDQSESDRIVSDLECLTGRSREEFGILPEEHSSVFGDVMMRYTVPGYEGREVDLTISPDGLPIGPSLMTAEPVETNAEIILAVESGGMFSRLIETGAWKRFGAILVQLGGQAPRATRKLINRLHKALRLPVFIFTDGDPWGMHIARVIMAGSANSAHIRNLTIPAAKWIGVTPQDIADYSLPTEPMNNADLKRLDELVRDIRYSKREWQEYIEKFRDLQAKAEQQAFSRHGIDYVVDGYLPNKLP
ncbi:MAG: DNA topoisomerase IV subunit A [Candidatus Thorarchaeota archaeon]|jgi:DNA topoisomerase-6 subunit A